MPRDVFEKHPLGFDLSDDAGNIWPEVARIVDAFALSRLGKRLAWVSGEDGINDSAPWPAVEGLDVIPDWRGMQVSGALSCDKAVSGVFFPLNIAGGGKARLGKSKTHVKSAAACTEGEAVSGR